MNVWNRGSLQPVRTMPSGYIIALMFCPCDRHLLAVTKAGRLKMFNLRSGKHIEGIK